MSYGRDRDAHTRGVGAIAAADHLRSRKARARLFALQTVRRDAQLAGLTYGPGGGLAGYGPLQALGAINLANTPMRSGWTPVINPGSGETPPSTPTHQPPHAFLPPRTVMPTGPTTVPPLTPLPPRGPIRGTTRPTLTAFPLPPATSLPPPSRIPPSRTFPYPGGGGGGGSSGGDTTDGGAGAGVVTGSSAGGGVIDQPSSLPPDPDMTVDDGTVTIAGVAVPKTALYVGGGLLAAYLLFGRKR